MRLAMIQNLNLNSFRATREPKRLYSAFGGNSYSLALRPESNGRLSEEVLDSVDKFSSSTDSKIYT